MLLFSTCEASLHGQDWRNGFWEAVTGSDDGDHGDDRH